MKNLGYSQNFLVNKKLVERLISKSNIDVTDYVIEIGPGKGIITDVLSQHAGEVVAVEYDQELYNNLVRYHSHDNVTYIFGDFLNHLLTIVVSIFLHRPFFLGTYQSHGTTVAHFLKHRRQNIFTL